MGVVFEVNGSVLKEGRMWYRIQQDTDLVHPERVRGVWYIASDFVRVHRYPGKQFSGAATSQTGKYIVIDISSQTLTAYQGKKVFLSAHVSTGLTGTPTPKGTFTIIKKQPSRYMQGPLPGISKQYYDLPGVPWNLYFTSQGAAIHGAYWHSNFGAQHSHGCVNLPVKTAKLLYDWTPVETTVFVQK
jgi:lipoprotein-anchoring transpeptidase ErfK/SrfK